MHDSHVHLNLEPLNKNIKEVIFNFKSVGGKYILTQSTDLLDIDDNLRLSAMFPEIISVAIGLHPTCFEEYTILKGNTKNIYEYSQKYITNWIMKFKKNIENIKAIGETGLDYYQYNLNLSETNEQKAILKEIQKLSFSEQIKLALEYKLPMSIHARDVQGESQTVKDAMRLLAQEGKGLVKGCFHSYTGDISLVQDILDLGFYIGFNAIITYKSGENVREILKQVPLERILLETDGPFLPPQSVRKNKNIKEKFAQPSDVKEVLKVISEVKAIDENKLENMLDRNFENLFAQN